MINIHYFILGLIMLPIFLVLKLLVFLCKVPKAFIKLLLDLGKITHEHFFERR